MSILLITHDLAVIAQIAQMVAVMYASRIVEYTSAEGPTQATVQGKTITFAPLGHLAPREKVTWRVVVRAAEAGDVRFKVTLNTDQLQRPVEETESTKMYE